MAAVAVGSACHDGLGSVGQVISASNLPSNISTICQFASGPRAGQQHDYEPMPPVPVGSPCHDGFGSAGQVVGGGASTTQTTQTCLYMAGPQRGYSPNFPNIGAVRIGTPCWDGVNNFGTAVQPSATPNPYVNGWNGDTNNATSVAPPPSAPVQTELPPSNVTPFEVGTQCITAGNQALIAACMAKNMPPNVAQQCVSNPSACFGRGTPLAIQTKVVTTIAQKAGIDVGNIAGKVDRVFGKIKIF